MDTAVRTRVPAQGVKTVTTTASPLTLIVSSGAGTVFTKTRVTDSAPWDLSNVQVGFLAKCGDFRGRITEVNNAGDYVVVQGWRYKGVSLRGLAERIPTDGDVVEIHKCDGCKQLLIDAADSNTADVFLGFDDNVAVSGADAGHPIAAGVGQPNHRLMMEEGVTPIIDLTEVYVIAASTQTIYWLAT